MKNLKEYIPAPDFWRSMFLHPEFGGRWVIKEKVPVSEIKIDKSLFSFQNKVDLEQVDSMVAEFTINLWIPITVNPDGFLLDGQHRLKTAEKLGLNYIDVVVDNGDDFVVKLIKKPRRRGYL